MPDQRSPHEVIADRLAVGTSPSTVYDRLVKADQISSYASERRLNLRAAHEYGQLNLED